MKHEPEKWMELSRWRQLCSSSFLEISAIFLEFTANFLELEFCTFQLLMPAYNLAAAHELLPAWLALSVSENWQFVNNSRSYFSVSCHPSASILGRAGKKIATLQTGSHHLVLICVEPAKHLCFVCNACEHWGVCQGAWQYQLSNESIHMAKICHWSQCIGIDFEEPGMCLDLFVICWPRLQIRASDCAEYYFD